MSYLAKIEGISGTQRFLARGAAPGIRIETTDEKDAKRYRSEDAAKRAAQAHIAAFPPVIQRAMKYEVVPAERAQ